MPPYISPDHIRGVDLTLGTDTKFPGFSWTGWVNHKDVITDTTVTFHRHLTTFSKPSKFFEFHSRECLDKSSSLVFLSGDESVFGRCFTVQSSREGPTCVTLVDARIDAFKLVAILRACVTEKSLYAIKMQAYQKIVGWPSSPVRRPPDLQSLFKDTRGPVRPVDLDDSVVECAATVDFGDLLVVVVNEQGASRLVDMVGDDDDIDAVSLFVKRMLRSSKTSSRLMVACQNTPENTLSIEHDSCSAQIGVPVATFAYAIDIDELWCEMDLEYAISSDLIKISEDWRQNVKDAERAIRQILQRPEIVESIKRHVWRPSGRLVRNMIADSK